MLMFRVVSSAALALVTLVQGTPTEHWMVVKIDGAEAGYARSVVRPVEIDGAKCVETANELGFAIKRLNQDIRLVATEAVIENARGQIIEKSETQSMSGVPAKFAGRVVGDSFHYVIEGAGQKREHTILWAADVPGPEEVKRRIIATGFKEGAVVRALQHKFDSTELYEKTWIIGPTEKIDVDGSAQRLHRTVRKEPSAPDTTVWLDDLAEEQKVTSSMIGMEFVYESATKQHVAKFVDGSAPGVELFAQTMIASNVKLPDPLTLTRITYSIRPKTAGAALPDFAAEAHQVEDDGAGGKRLTVVARTPNAPRRQALPIKKPTPELAECLAPDSLLQSDAPEIVALAKQGVGDAKDPWIAAQRLEALVRRTITKKSMGGFASALEVCQTKEGDCTEHATLLVALCRAAGIPARVAMGLGYLEGQFGGHAWAEVWIDGSWYGLDGTLGAGVVDPTHIRLGTTSLKGGGFGEAMMAIANGLGTMQLKVLEYARGNEVTKVP